MRATRVTPRATVVFGRATEAERDGRWSLGRKENGIVAVLRARRSIVEVEGGREGACVKEGVEGEGRAFPAGVERKDDEP